LAEHVGPAIDKLNRAERLGWISTVEPWLHSSRLRDRMIHGDDRDPSELAAALTLAHETVPLLERATLAMMAMTARALAALR
jgi:hypothetical protein